MVDVLRVEQVWQGKARQVRKAASRLEAVYERG